MADSDDDGPDGSCDDSTGTSRTTVIRKSKNILKELSKYDIPDDVRLKANEIFISMAVKIHRNKIETQRQYYCVYNAYIELNIAVNYEELAKKFGLTKGEAQKAINRFTTLQTGYKPVSKKFTCIDFIPGKCKKYNFTDETILDIQNMAKRILEKNPLLMEKNVVYTADAVIRYYTTINGIKSEGVDAIKNTPVDNLYKIIVEIENNIAVKIF